MLHYLQLTAEGQLTYMLHASTTDLRKVFLRGEATVCHNSGLGTIVGFRNLCWGCCRWCDDLKISPTDTNSEVYPLILETLALSAEKNMLLPIPNTGWGPEFYSSAK